MAEATVVREVFYSEPVGFRPIALDLYLPAGRPAPLIVFVHGGGFRMGSRRMFVPTMRDMDPFTRLVDAGFAVASIDYRLSSEAVFPAQVDDVLAAIAWLREHADEHGIDASRVVLWGESAGATLAALAGLTGGVEVRGVIDWYGPADIRAMATQLGELDDPETREAGWLGGTVASLPERAREASPAEQVHAGAPPFLIAHGLNDAAVPHEQSELLEQALVRAGIPVTLELVPDAGHVWSGPVDREGLLDRALDFAREVTS